MVDVFQCAGREARGSILACHPHADPGGWHVQLGATYLSETYATREQALAMAAEVATWVAVAIRYDREGTMAKRAGDPQQEVLALVRAETPR